MNKKPQPVSGGNYYEVGPAGMAPLTGRPRPDAWVCRRVADYPGATVPEGASIAACTLCGEAVAHGKPPCAPEPPKVCMQCASITPLQIDAEEVQ